jgi:hypothetical protein
VAVISRWSSDNGLALVKVQSTLGLGTRWLVVERVKGGGEYVLSRHRKKSAAVKAVEVRS